MTIRQNTRFTIKTHIAALFSGCSCSTVLGRLWWNIFQSVLMLFFPAVVRCFCMVVRAFGKGIIPCRMFPGRLVFNWCCGVLCAGMVAHAGPASSDTLELYTITVKQDGTRDEHAVKDKIKLSEEERMHLSVDQMLLKTPGITTSKTGGIGGYLGVSLWGSSDNQVNIYVNGMPQNQAANGASFLSDIDPAQIEEIEVYKGMAPDFLEGSPIGGVINIITKQGQKGARLQADLGIGSFGRYKANAGVQLGNSLLNTFFHAGWDQGENDYDYPFDNKLETESGSYKEAKDLDKLTFSHNQHQLFTLHSVTSMYLGKGHSFSLDGGFSGTDKNFSIFGVDTAGGPSRQSHKLNTQLQYKHKTVNKKNLLSLRLYYNTIQEEYDDRGGDLGKGKDYDNDVFYTIGAVAWDRLQINHHLNIAVQGSYSIKMHQFTNMLNNTVYPMLYRYQGEGKLAPQYRFNEHHRLRLQAVASYVLEEYYEGYRESAFGVKLPTGVDHGLWSAYGEYGYTPIKNVETFVSVGNGYRLPTFNERFGDKGTIEGNPELLPEKSLNISTGVIYNLPWMSISTRYFLREGRNTITFRQNSQNTIKPENTDQTQVNGEEISVRVFKQKRFSSLINLTHQTAINKSVPPGDEFRQYAFLPHIPVMQLYVSQDLFWKYFCFNVNAYYRGITISNPSGSANLYDQYNHNTTYQFQLNARLSYRVGKLQGVAGVDNITNESLEDYFTSPLPGRSYKATIQIQM
ncbi:MAG: TonB-dependent receptor [Fibrobacteria bacterium]|nr:TonB-dependent receptor [Fibrobacteria bacterium]